MPDRNLFKLRNSQKEAAIEAIEKKKPGAADQILLVGLNAFDKAIAAEELKMAREQYQRMLQGPILYEGDDDPEKQRRDALAIKNQLLYKYEDGHPEAEKAAIAKAIELGLSEEVIPYVRSLMHAMVDMRLTLDRNQLETHSSDNSLESQEDDDCGYDNFGVRVGDTTLP